MRYLFSTLVCLVWGLWLGGLCTLVTVVIAMSHAISGAAEALGIARSAVFHTFERYQLILAAMSLLVTFGWVLTRPAAAKTALFALFALASALALLETRNLTPRIDSLYSTNQTHTPSFQQAHHWALDAYGTQTALLALGGLLLPLGLRADNENDKSK